MPILDERSLEFLSHSPEQTQRLGVRLGVLLFYKGQVLPNRGGFISFGIEAKIIFKTGNGLVVFF